MSTTALATPTPSHTQNASSMGKPALSKITEIVIITATLVILLLVSATVVARTYFLRRYRREMLARALADGTHPLAQRDPGDRPRMFSVYVGEDLLAEEGYVSEKRREREKLGDGELVAWDEIMVRPTSLRAHPRARSGGLAPC